MKSTSLFIEILHFRSEAIAALRRVWKVSNSHRRIIVHVRVVTSQIVD